MAIQYSRINRSLQQSRNLLVGQRCYQIFIRASLFDALFITERLQISHLFHILVKHPNIGGLDLFLMFLHIILQQIGKSDIGYLAIQHIRLVSYQWFMV